MTRLSPLVALATIALLSWSAPLNAADSTPEYASGIETVETLYETVGWLARFTYEEGSGFRGTGDNDMTRLNIGRATKTRLTDSVNQSCERRRRKFLRKNIRWMKVHTDSRGLNFVSKYNLNENRDYFIPYKELLQTYSDMPEASAFLAPGQSLFEVYDDPKLDIRQRVQWSVLLGIVAKDLAQKHDADYKDFDTALAMTVTAQVRCEMVYRNSKAIQSYLKANGLSADTDKAARIAALNHAMRP